MKFLEKKVYNYIIKNNLLKNKQAVILAFSGGPDSTALFHVLLSLQYLFNIQLYAFHLNHKLRETDSESDSHFVFTKCRQNKIPLKIIHYPVKTYCHKKKISIELGARKIRYFFLRKYCRQVKADVIMTAHHFNDQVETVIMRLFKGTGSEGLSGILPKNGILIRPFLSVQKQEILAYLQKNKIDYCLDKTNNDPITLRNKIRLLLLPEIRKYFPKVDKHLYQISDILRHENVDRQKKIRSLLESIILEKTEKFVRIDYNKFFHFPLSVRRKMIRQLILKNFHCLLSYEQITWITDRRIHKANHIYLNKKRLKIYKECTGLFFSKTIDLKMKNNYYHTIDIESNVVFSTINILLKVVNNINRIHWQENFSFDWEMTSKPLAIRNRRTGDLINLPSGRKKIKNLFIDTKIPVNIRDQIPIIVDQNNIIGILAKPFGYRNWLRKDCYITKNTKKIGFITYDFLNNKK